MPQYLLGTKFATLIIFSHRIVDSSGYFPEILSTSPQAQSSLGPSEVSSLLFKASSPTFHVTLVVEIIIIHLLSSADDEKSPEDETDCHENEECDDPDAQLAGLGAGNKM